MNLSNIKEESIGAKIEEINEDSRNEFDFFQEM